MNIGGAGMKTLTTRGHQYQLEILKYGSNWVDLLMTRNPTVEKFYSLGLTDCFTVTGMRELLTTELQENWRTLQHHKLHPSIHTMLRGTSKSALQMPNDPLGNVDVDVRHDGVKDNVHNVLKRDTSKQGDDVRANHVRLDREWFAQYVSFRLYNDVIPFNVRVHVNCRAMLHTIIKCDAVKQMRYSAQN